MKIPAVLAVLLTAGAFSAAAQEGNLVTGTVVDQLGGKVAKATVTLSRDGQRVGETSSSDLGAFSFDNVPEGRYRLAVRADGFEQASTDTFFVSAPRAWPCLPLRRAPGIEPVPRHEYPTRFAVRVVVPEVEARLRFRNRESSDTGLPQRELHQAELIADR
jgi:hypothetical protein